MFEKRLIAILAALLLPYCATTPIAPTEEERLAAEANATASTSAVAVPAGQTPIRIPLLAIEVEFTAEGVKPLGAKIVHAAPRANSAFGDLRVQAGGVDGWGYTMADPRLVKGGGPDDARAIVLESARTHVYVPLLVAVTELSIQPATTDDPDVSRGGRFDVLALAAAACAQMRMELPVCRQIAERSGSE
jgi:hypothetical protein